MGVKEKVQEIGGLANSGVTQAQDKVNELISGKKYNPFLDKEGNIKNKLINYHAVLDNPNVGDKAKEYITQATGLTTKNNNRQDKVRSFLTGTNASGNGIVNAAKKYIGTPYVWGGESASEGGMDCSGFVYNALKDAGYNVGRQTAQGYRSYGTKVNKSDIQPGDLIFYGGDKASHIGIYIGNGQMVHSSGDSGNTKSNPGKGVSVTNIDYRSDFIEARRY